MTTTKDLGSLPLVQLLRRASPPLGTLTTLGVGGPSTHYLEATSEHDVLEALAFAKEHALGVYALGGGSNVVVADTGVDGLVLRLGTRGLDVEKTPRGIRVTVQAGENWDELTRLCATENWAGVECLGGIPGAVGATPIQNVGAYGQEVSDTIERVRVVDRLSLEVSELDHAACAFGYRNSYFKTRGQDRFVVLSVTYLLGGDRPSRDLYPELARALAVETARPDLVTLRQTVIELRRRKSMILDPADENGRSCGSFFVNAELTASEVAFVAAQSGISPPAFPQSSGLFKVPSAWLIEHAGLQKGETRGPVGLSTKHTLSIVAHEGASASDVVEFARYVRERVKERFDVTLVAEPNFWGFGRLEAGLPARIPT